MVSWSSSWTYNRYDSCKIKSELNLLAGIIVMTGLYSVNLRIMGKSNIPLFMSKHLFNGTVSAIVVVVIFLLIVKLAIDFYLKQNLDLY